MLSPKACPYAMALSFWVVWCGFFTKNLFYHQCFFAVKRRAVFILEAKWKALVRGWRRDCVVGGMETRFQWRKTHSRTAKCEAFHFASRLFFMFLFLIPLTIRQQSLIYTQKFPTEPWFPFSRFLLILGAKKGYADLGHSLVLIQCRCGIWGLHNFFEFRLYCFFEVVSWVFEEFCEFLLLFRSGFLFCFFHHSFEILHALIFFNYT